jgi:hypothetical protein
VERSLYMQELASSNPLIAVPELQTQ